MGSVKEIRDKADKISEVYEKDLYPLLEEKSNTIYNSLRKNLNKLCLDRKIVKKSSIYSESYPFSLIYRVKDKNSLKEKIIRKSLFDDVYNQNEKVIIENINNKINDLIGITILVDNYKNLKIFADFILNNEVDNFEVVSKKEGSNIKFGDLSYYNIKTNFVEDSSKTSVEIQVKSTIVSAFTNLEHKLIYKNRDLSVMKNNNNLIIKALTPSVRAIEEVISSIEESFVNSDNEIAKYHRQKRIQEVLYNEAGQSNCFDAFITDIDKIIYRSLKGFLIKTNNNEDNENEKKERDFLKKFIEFNDEENKISIKQEDLSLKLLISIGQVNKDFLDNLIYFDYFDYLENNLKLPVERSTYLDRTNLEAVKNIINHIDNLKSNSIDIYEELLLDKGCRTIRFINEAENKANIFLEDLEESFDEKLIEKVLQKAILFLFQYKEKSVENLVINELEDIGIDTDPLEKELIELIKERI